MRRNFWILFAALAVFVAALVCWRFLFPKPSMNSKTQPRADTFAEHPGSADTSSLATAALHRTNSLSKVNSMQDWRSKLQSLTQGEAIKAIQDFLRTGQDAPTQQPFTIGPDGHLTSAPTLRTFLMDELGKRDPAAAARVAEQILKDSSSPDEWALALKYYALGSSNPEKKSFLQQKLQTLLRNADWQRNPSVGYLESFDVAVWLGGTDLLPALCDLARKKDNQAVAHASFLTLDRLIQAEPAATLDVLQNQPSLMEGREQTRANFFARADVGDPRQRTILEKYLLNPGMTGTELQAFAGLYPNANYMVSYNLLTQVKTPDGASLSQKDARALQVVNEWLADDRFARLRPQLETMRNRLRNFVK